MFVPSRKTMPSDGSRSFNRSKKACQTPSFVQRRKSWAAVHHGPRSDGTERHLEPLWWRQNIADMVRRRSRGGVLPFGRTASIRGSQARHASSEITDCIVLITQSYARQNVFQDITGPKIFTNGRSQAVHLPAPFRFEGTEVYIRGDEATGDVILSRRPEGWDSLFAAIKAGGVSDDFLGGDERS